MGNILEEKIAEALTLPLVPLSGVHAYQQNITAMTAAVDEALELDGDISRLVGEENMQMMRDNHRHHASFLATVFSIGGYGMLARTVPWVYRAYSSHGFSYDYFPMELQAWKNVISAHIDQHHVTQILAVYDWMMDNHDQWIQLAENPAEDRIPVGEEWMEVKDGFREHILSGDFRASMATAERYLEDNLRIIDLYTHIIQPAMYEIGLMWEKGDITVAQEHLASAVVSRLMAGMAIHVEIPPEARGRAIVTAAPGEYHELGAWMLSDILEQDGWNVSYLGANTPHADLIRYIDDTLPNILALSVTMPFNIGRAKNLIEAVRRMRAFSSMKILVGGRVFIDNPEMERIVGADAFAANLDEALRITRSWSAI